MVKLEANLFRGTKISGKYGNRYFKKGSSLIQRIKRQIYLSSREISNVKHLYFYYNFNFDKSIFRLDLNRTINVTFSMHNNQSSLSTVQAYKIHEYFSSFPFTFLSAPSDVLYIYIYILSDCKTSLMLSPLLSLSLSQMSPTHCIAVPLCLQSRQKRFVRSPRKIPPHVYYNTHSFSSLRFSPLSRDDRCAVWKE